MCVPLIKLKHWANQKGLQLLFLDELNNFIKLCVEA